MTVIRVHELAKKMGVESKDLILVLEKMGITAKTPSSGLDDKESKSLIEKLKAAKFFGNPTKGNADQVPRGARIPALGGLRRCKSSP